MKKLVAFFLMLALLLGVSALAEDGMGVQVIGGPGAQTEPVTLDDFKLNVDVSIDMYGVLNGTSFETLDRIGYYKKGKTYLSYNYEDYFGYSYSGNEAEYMVLKMDIINTALTEKNFIDKCKVKAVYDEIYEFGGWCHQYNYNNGTYEEYRGAYGADAKKQNKNFYINKEDRFAIQPMYEGHYCFGVTLPNAVINSEKPLYIVITIDEHEITYHVRK